MDEASTVLALTALAAPARLRVFRSLVAAGPEGMTPSALSTVLEIPPSTLSFHLKELIHARLVTVERDGRHLHYRPSFGTMDGLISYLTDHCCQGKGCAPAGKPRRRPC